MGEGCFPPRALGDTEGEPTRMGGEGGGDIGNLFLINGEGGEVVLHGSGAFLERETLLRSGEDFGIIVFREAEADGDALRHGMVKEGLRVAESGVAALLNLSSTIPSLLLTTGLSI